MMITGVASIWSVTLESSITLLDGSFSLIYDIKSPGLNVIKNFASVIYEFS
jgi:hypothetical protein